MYCIDGSSGWVFRCRVALVVVFLLVSGFACADAALLKVLVDDSTEMPMADIADGHLRGGLHRDIGLLLAGVLQREPRFVVRPRNRVAMALAQGDADIICAYTPQWLPGPFTWSAPVMTQNEVVITPLGRPNPKALAQLAGKPVGTVLGFRYPEIESVLRGGFVRDDAPQASNNLQKLAAGRIDHAVVGEIYLDYQIRLRQFALQLHPRIISSSVQTGCALSPLSDVSMKRLNDGIASLQKAGKLVQVMQKYR